ncbi:MAG: tagaturonate epimerase family protein [Bacteroidales bacterium]|jgi:hypothetical protein|nr:tagaturonate epimerase family protein [Bacteroidales bacterium]
MKDTGKYSFGLGDRFGHQGEAQLKAIIDAGNKGVEITPVWNKSNREHSIIGTGPDDVRKEADHVTSLLGFSKPYFVDADHINFDTVDRFIGSSDFFTIDVASYIGIRAEETEIEKFLSGAMNYAGDLKLPAINKSLTVTKSHLNEIALKYLYATRKAGELYRKIESLKGPGNFVTEISMDEVQSPQTPAELFFILKMLNEEGIPLATIAPKFSGRFNKGVDYEGDIKLFATEFEADLMVISLAVKEFGLPENLKISVHSGSDKFSIYPVIGSIIKKHDKGIHVKTAGTTWLEEVTGLAESGDEALKFAKDLYVNALDKMEEFCAPYADVIDIKKSALPEAMEVMGWNGKRFADSIRHIPDNLYYNKDMRQLIHISYKLAAMQIDKFNHLLDQNREVIYGCVYENIYYRHICRLFDIK